MSCCDDRKVNTQILESMNLISEKLSCVCNQIVSLFQNFLWSIMNVKIGFYSFFASSAAFGAFASFAFATPP